MDMDWWNSSIIQRRQVTLTTVSEVSRSICGARAWFTRIYTKIVSNQELSLGLDELFTL